jgi:hypothetical protein
MLRQKKMMKKPKLIQDWKKTAKNAWSVRFMVLSGLSTVGEIVISYFPDSLPRGAMAGLSGTFALLGIISRFYQQRNMSDEN